jgi:hypothetical protein
VSSSLQSSLSDVCGMLTIFVPGFFEQGLLLNVGLILTVTISATAAGTVWLVKNGRIPSLGLFRG